MKKNDKEILPSSAEIKEFVDLIPTNEQIIHNYKTKMSPEFVKAMAMILDAQDKAAWLTDEQLLKLINYRLPTEKRIALRTYQEWKTKAKENKPMYNEQFRMFKELLEMIEITKELKLVGQLEDGTKNYLSIQWLLERSPKFRAKYGKNEGVSGVDLKGNKGNLQINFNF